MVYVDRERKWEREGGFQGHSGAEIREFEIIGELNVAFQGLKGGL